MDTRVSRTSALQRVYSFGDFTLDLERGALQKCGADVRLRPKSFEMLCYLVENHGRLVSKDELLNAVWGHTVVTEGSITQCLIDIRRILGDKSQSLIRTVPRRGYIFDAPVSESVETASPVAADTVSVARSASDRAQAIKNRLTWIFAGCLLLVFAGAWVAVETFGMKTRHDVGATRRSIAVLPFVDLSPEQDQGHLADGVAEEIHDLLAHVRTLRVIARTSSFSFKGANTDLRTIAEKLNVAYVLEGTVRKSADRIRITAKVIDAVTGSPAWSQTYDRKLEDAFAVQTEIATAVAQALNVTLANVTERDIRASVNSEAFSVYLQGRFFYNRRASGDVERAVKLYEEALRLDPRLARAWVGLAAAYTAQAGDGTISNDVGLAKRRLAIGEALMLDHHLAEAHIRAAELAWDTGDIAAVAKHHREAVASEPDNPIVLAFSSNEAAWNDRLDDAIVLARRVVTLDPLSAVMHGHLASLLLAVGRFEDAKTEFIKQLQLSSIATPDTDPAIGFILILEHKFDEALALIEHWPAGDDKDQAVAMIGRAVAREADAGAAMQRLNSSKQLGSAVRLAEVHAFRGDSDQAFNALQTARNKITSDSWSSPDWIWMWQLRFSPFLRPLHTDPRWPQLRPPKPPLRTVAAR